MEEDKIISALIGLVGACNNNPKTEKTDLLVIKALAFPALWPKVDNETIRTLIEEIYTEKYTVAPGCAACQMPCGNTSDYDMNRIYDAEANLRELKFKILSALKDLAADIYSGNKMDALSEKSVDFFYKALVYISLDMGSDGLFTFWNEVQSTIEEIRRQIEE